MFGWFKKKKSTVKMPKLSDKLVNDIDTALDMQAFMMGKPHYAYLCGLNKPKGQGKVLIVNFKSKGVDYYVQ